MGGLSGQALEPTPARIRQPVDSGRLRFFQLVTGPPSGPEADKITSWVKPACRMIPAKDSRGATAVGLRPSPAGAGRWHSTNAGGS